MTDLFRKCRLYKSDYYKQGGFGISLVAENDENIRRQMEIRTSSSNKQLVNYPIMQIGFNSPSDDIRLRTGDMLVA